MLPDNSAAADTPRICPVVIKYTSRSITGKIVIKCHGRFTRQQGIKTGNYLFYRPLTAFMGIPESYRTPDQLFGIADHVSYLLDLIEGRRGATKVFSRDSYTRNHDQQVGMVEQVDHMRIIAELVDGPVSYGKLMFDQCSGNRADIGGNIRRDPKTCRFIHIAVKDKCLSRHGRSPPGASVPRTVCPASSDLRLYHRGQTR